MCNDGCNKGLWKLSDLALLVWYVSVLYEGVWVCEAVPAGPGHSEADTVFLAPRPRGLPGTGYVIETQSPRLYYKLRLVCV